MSDDSQEKLNKIMLEYYTLLLNEKKEEERKRLEHEKGADRKLKEINKIWDKFRKLKDKRIIEDVTKILNKKIENGYTITSSFNDLLDVDAVKYFLDLGIDIKSIYDGFDIGERYEKMRYFDKCSIDEKVRWERIESEIKVNIENFRKELRDRKIKEEYKDKLDKFLKKAIEKGLHDVSTSHIRMLATEMDEDIGGSLNLLTTAVSTKLREHWGINEPKRKRELTKSIKLEVFKRDEYKCQECGKGRESKLHVHHVIPHSLGGTDEMKNLITLCESCNQSIGGRKYNPPEEWKKRNRY